MKSLYHRLPRIYVVFLRNIYYSILKAYLRLYYVCKYGNPDMFDDIIIETTTQCNRRCEYCPNSLYERSLVQNQKLMSEDLFIRIINELKDLKFTGRISPHFYGEPLLDKRLGRLMNYAHETIPNAKLKIYTNGDLLDIPMLDVLYEVGVRNYLVTLHGNKEERQSKRTRVHDLQKHITENKKNIKIDILDITDNTYLSNRGGLVKVKNPTENIYCLNSHNPLTINYKGDVLLCCNDYLGKVSFGNIATEPLLAIWNNADFRRIRREIKKGIIKLDICEKCVS